MTFGDKIRSMTNEELADFFQKILNCDVGDFVNCQDCLFGSVFCPFICKNGRWQASKETLVKFLNHENLVYEDLVSEWFDRSFTDGETKFVQDVLKEKIKKGNDLTSQECEIANDSWYHEAGDIIDSDGRYAEVEIILSIDDDFYCLIQKTSNFESFFECQSAEKVVAKPIQVIKWIKADEN